MEKLMMIPVEKIQVGKHEQRIAENQEAFDELVNSIKQIGLINPIVCNWDGHTYTLVAGHRRLAAFRELGKTEIPAFLREQTETIQSAVTFAENFCRAELTPIELACAIKDCIEAKAMTVEQVAQTFHKTVHWVQRQVAIVAWPQDVQEVIHAKKISIAAAENLAQVTEESYRKFLVRQAADNGATARTTAAWLQAYRSMQPPEQAIEAEPIAKGQPPAPMVPQAPCLACGQVQRTDRLSHVPLCQGCITAIRNAGTGF